MNQLEKTLTSLEVAKMVGRRHDQVMTGIVNIITHLATDHESVLSEYFITDIYKDSTGRRHNCFKLTKKGCELFSTRMTGEKGTRFAIAYIERFNDMENHIKQNEIDTSQLSPELQIMNNMLKSLAQQEIASKEIKQEIKTVNHRLDNIDSLDTIGDLQQRLNAMIRRYAQLEGIDYGKAWSSFRVAFNTAYRTNLKLLVKNYKKKHNLNKLTLPSYLSLVDRLPDAIRVSDKMLNKEEKS